MATPEVFRQFTYGVHLPVVQFSDLVKADTTLTGTPTVVDLGANNRPFNKQVFRIFNQTAATVVEYLFGGQQKAVCSGTTPVVEVVASGLYEVTVSDTTKFDVGEPLEIYDADSANAVLLNGVVASVDRVNNKLRVAYVSTAGDPTDAAANDPVGGPDRYTFTTGQGHLLFATSFVDVRPPADYRYLLLRASTGSPVIRVTQVM